MQFLKPTFDGLIARHTIPPGGANPPSRYNEHRSHLLPPDRPTSTPTATQAREPAHTTRRHAPHSSPTIQKGQSYPLTVPGPHTRPADQPTRLHAQAPRPGHQRPNSPQRRAHLPRRRPPRPDPRRPPRPAHRHRRTMGPPGQTRLDRLHRRTGHRHPNRSEEIVGDNCCLSASTSS
jgi:hypothetical protein